MVEKESLTCLEISHILLKIWFEEIKFFPIIIDILIKFEVFMNSLLWVYRQSGCIAIDYSSIGLNRLKIWLVFSKAWIRLFSSWTHEDVTCGAGRGILIWTSQKKLKMWTAMNRSVHYDHKKWDVTAQFNHNKSWTLRHMSLPRTLWETSCGISKYVFL